ncbi:hypothetical protein Hypma_004457 [Hypsizygus marmoreus]|uniref:Uncharacterized protein n=1 Tax=Hypsizygus marmoreus TaxID=39966 RepID=A0A369JZP0_HYPMA|nr:hypothetical protein Hypma_004457 [Hypsizygus marmoreus]
MQPIYPLLGVSRPFDPSCTHVTSPFFSPFVLAALRLTFALYTLVTLLVTLIWDSVRVGIGEAFFSYFTHLSYIGLCAYFFASGTQILLYSLRSRQQNHTYPLQGWPRPLKFLHVLLQLTVITFPILVTVVFWALLASSEIFHASYSTWSNISVHILNTVFGLSEMLLTNVPPPPWLLLPFGVVLLAGYLAIAYITYADQGFYPYTFLNPQTEKTYLAAYIIGIALGYCILFVIVRYIVVLRIKLVGWRRAGRGGRGREGREEMEEWEEVERPSKEGV